MLFSKNTADFEKAYEIISRSFPGITKDRVEMFTAGFDHAVLVVDGSHAFRFPKNAEYLQKLTVTADFLEAFAPLSPIPVPVQKSRTIRASPTKPTASYRANHSTKR